MWGVETQAGNACGKASRGSVPHLTQSRSVRLRERSVRPQTRSSSKSSISGPGPSPERQELQGPEPWGDVRGDWVAEWA